MARLVKAGTPRALPAPGEYSPEEQLWLEAAAQAGKKAGKGKGKPTKGFDKADARSARRESFPQLPRGRAGPEYPHSGRRGRGSHARPRVWQPGRSLRTEYFPALAQRPAVVHGGGVLLPVPFPQTTLHVLRAGVFVGSVQKGRFVPEHHLFTAFGAQCTNREELTLDRPPHRGISLGPGDRGPHRRRRLVLRDRGRLAPGRRQSVRRAGQKPLPQGAAPAVKRYVFDRISQNRRIRLERVH